MCFWKCGGGIEFIEALKELQDLLGEKGFASKKWHFHKVVCLTDRSEGASDVIGILWDGVYFRPIIPLMNFLQLLVSCDKLDLQVWLANSSMMGDE